MSTSTLKIRDKKRHKEKQQRLNKIAGLDWVCYFRNKKKKVGQPLLGHKKQGFSREPNWTGKVGGQKKGVQAKRGKEEGRI